MFDDIDDFASVAQTKISGGYLYSPGRTHRRRSRRVISSLEGSEATACFGAGMAQSPDPPVSLSTAIML